MKTAPKTDYLFRLKHRVGRDAARDIISFKQADEIEEQIDSLQAYIEVMYEQRQTKITTSHIDR
jgi:uncharacterized small protein (DUF1192 family)